MIPLYLQTVLELNALESGIRMLPMSVCLFLVALLDHAWPATVHRGN